MLPVSVTRISRKLMSIYLESKSHTVFWMWVLLSCHTRSDSHGGKWTMVERQCRWSEAEAEWGRSWLFLSGASWHSLVQCSLHDTSVTCHPCPSTSLRCFLFLTLSWCPTEEVRCSRLFSATMTSTPTTSNLGEKRLILSPDSRILFILCRKSRQQELE